MGVEDLNMVVGVSGLRVGSNHGFGVGVGIGVGVDFFLRVLHTPLDMEHQQEAV